MEVVFDCWYPSCVEVIVNEFDLVVIPLVRGDCWSVGFEPYPSCVRLIVVWLSAYPSKCRGDLCCALPLV